VVLPVSLTGRQTEPTIMSAVAVNANNNVCTDTTTTTTTTTTDTKALHQVLKHTFGHSTFRRDQERVIRAVLMGSDAL